MMKFDESQFIYFRMGVKFKFLDSYSFILTFIYFSIVSTRAIMHIGVNKMSRNKSRMSSEEKKFIIDVGIEANIIISTESGLCVPNILTVATKNSEEAKKRYLEYVDPHDTGDIDPGPCGNIDRVLLLIDRFVKRTPKDSSQGE